jgi:predicted RNA binding protein YcfA (HicA-like mRNA interferase family)
MPILLQQKGAQVQKQQGQHVQVQHSDVLATQPHAVIFQDGKLLFLVSNVS